MRLYLKCGSATKVISDITLRDGHQPAIGNTLPCRPDTGELIPIEPALWYKTLLIDAILVDCDSQELKWKREKFQKLEDSSLLVSKDRSLSSTQEFEILTGDFPLLQDFEESLFGRGVYDYEPTTDTVFQEVNELFETPNKKISDEECKLTVLRLLHCYILPHIVLCRKDIPLLEQALKFMDRQMQLAETAIDKKSENVELIQTTLKRIRELFIDEFQKEACVRLYNSEFLRKMLYKLQSDIDELSAEFEHLQNEVNKIKDHGTDNLAVERLAEKRKLRDTAWKLVERSTTMRENVRNVVARPQKVKRFRRILGLKPTLLDSQNKYMEVHKLFEEQKAEMLDLYGRKVRVISVREAIKAAITDLVEDTETLGEQLKIDGSERATDVMGMSGKPDDWMTLEERVGNLISASNTGLNSMHNELCISVKGQINTVLDEEGIFTTDQENNITFEHLENTFETALDLAGVHAQRRRTRSSSSRLIQSLCLYGEDTVCPLKAHCENLKNAIHNGIARIVQYLMEEHSLSSSEGKLWMCYETHIYPQIMPQLLKLYQSAYKPLTNMLAKKLPTLMPKDLNVQEDWLLELTELEEKRPSTLPLPLHHKCPFELQTETSVKRSLSDCSDTELPGEGTTELSNRISYELSGKSLHQLYVRANQDGQRIQEELSSHRLALENISDDESSETIQSHNQTDLVHVSPDDRIDTCLTEISNATFTETRALESECLNATQIQDNTCALQHDPVVFDAPVRCSFRVEFQPAMDYVCSISDNVTVLSKLIQLTKAFRFIGHKVSELRSGHSKPGNRAEVYRACCDDMVTVCLLLLTYLQPEEIKCFYANLCLMHDLLAPCLRHGVHDCTIVNFKTAFQYVIEEQIGKQQNERRLLLDGDLTFNSDV